ncbi:MAG: hypothetical protein SPI59_05745 [Finegoldia sp.]|nr:hypothetical protein [Finegoldia sp.]
MAVKIIRDSGSMGSFSKMRIFIDGSYCESIRQGAVEYLVLKSYPRKLQVRLFGAKSNTIEVNDNDTVVIRTKKSTIALLIVYMIGIFIAALTSYSYQLIIGLLIIYLLISVLIDSYYLEIIDEDKDKNKKTKKKESR